MLTLVVFRTFSQHHAQSRQQQPASTNCICVQATFLAVPLHRLVYTRKNFIKSCQIFSAFADEVHPGTDRINRSVAPNQVAKYKLDFSLRGLSVGFTKTDLKPLNNNLQRIESQFCRVIVKKEVWMNSSKLIKNHFSWKSTGKVFPNAPVRMGTFSSRITMRKMFDAERKDLTVNTL